MIRGIAGFMPPELVKILMEMGHGDEIAVCDRNFPAISFSKRLVRCDGIRIEQVLSEILRLLPLDVTVDYQAVMMQLTSDNTCDTLKPVNYMHIFQENGLENISIDRITRNDFYIRSENAFAVVITGEERRFSNIIIRKGIF